MATEIEEDVTTRAPLTRERVLEAAVAFADENGIEELSMRKLGHELGVEAMSLYHHVKNKDEILNGMVDAIAMEIQIDEPDPDWRTAMRTQILAAREAMKRHTWAPKVIETRTDMSFPMLKYMDSVGGIFLSGGFSVDLMHHAMHVLGSRLLGFTQELFDDKDASDGDEAQKMAMLEQMATEIPNITAVIREIDHRQDDIIGSGCDDDYEFLFALDIILDGLERHRDREVALRRD